MDRETASIILSRVRSEKQAASPVEAFREAATAPLKQQALQDMKNMALFTGGLGMAAGGGVGLYNLLRRNLKPKKRTTHIAELPIPVEMEESDPNYIKQGNWLSDLARGQLATTTEGIPWALPGRMAAGLGAGIGGFKLVDSLMRARQRKQDKRDVEKARAEFEQALLANTGAGKQASDSSMEKLSADLDKLYDLFEKTSGLLDNVGVTDNGIGTGLGMYAGLYGIPAALIAGHAAYKATARRSQRKILEKALKLRAQRRQALEPAELVARQVPVQSFEG